MWEPPSRRRGAAARRRRRWCWWRRRPPRIPSTGCCARRWRGWPASRCACWRPGTGGRCRARRSVPANTRLVEWLSYAQTMPGCALVICHAGHGTLVRALASVMPGAGGAARRRHGRERRARGLGGRGGPAALAAAGPATLRLATRRALRGAALGRARRRAGRVGDAASWAGAGGRSGRAARRTLNRGPSRPPNPDARPVPLAAGGPTAGSPHPPRANPNLIFAEEFLWLLGALGSDGYRTSVG